MNKNKVVLNYGESLLRQHDVDLLKGPFWLNDSIISFYFEFLEKDCYPSYKYILFVSPEVTQCIKMSPESEISLFLDPLLENEKREFIFFALNDNDALESSGGSHWSLLVLSIPEKMIFHFDSSNGSNYTQAEELGYKLGRYFTFPLNCSVENVPCLQQNNGYDCGIHVLANVEHLANHVIHYKTIRTFPKLPPESVQMKRSEILTLIQQLSERKS